MKEPGEEHGIRRGPLGQSPVPWIQRQHLLRIPIITTPSSHAQLQDSTWNASKTLQHAIGKHSADEGTANALPL